MSEQGINKDEGKLRLDLVPPEVVEAFARVSGKACESGKYTERNWEKGMDWSRQYASAQRHLLKWMKGEDMDGESGCTHLEHALWRLGALVTYEKRGIGFDDRPKAESPTDYDQLRREEVRHAAPGPVDYDEALAEGKYREVE